MQRKTDDKIDQRVQFLFTKRERQALERLADHDGVSMGHVVRTAVRGLAKRKKCWD